MFGRRWRRNPDWQRSARLYETLVNGGSPGTVTAEGLADGERCFADLEFELTRIQSEGDVRTVLTDRRLRVEAGGRWLDLPIQDLRGLDLDVPDWTLELTYTDTPPIRLTGADAPAYALILAWLAEGPSGVRRIGAEVYDKR